MINPINKKQKKNFFLAILITLIVISTSIILLSCSKTNSQVDKSNKFIDDVMVSVFTDWDVDKFKIKLSKRFQIYSNQNFDNYLNKIFIDCHEKLGSLKTYKANITDMVISKEFIKINYMINAKFEHGDAIIYMEIRYFDDITHDERLSIFDFRIETQD